MIVRLFLVFLVLQFGSVGALPTKLQKLRSLFLSDSAKNVTNGRGLDGYILQNTDAHENEYIANKDKRIEFLTGFTGSYAEIFVTKNNAVLMTDGRYIEQARLQVNNDWMIVDRGQSVPLTQIIEDNMKAGSYIGFDPELVTYEFATTTLAKLAPRNLVPIRGNLVDKIWADRPPVGHNQIRFHLPTVTFHEYLEANDWLRIWQSAKIKNGSNYIVFVPKTANFEIGQVFASNMKMGVSPVQKDKSMKNTVEMNGMRKSSIRDSAYIIEFLEWTEKQVKLGKKPNELELADKITSIRAQDDKFIGNSFEPISSIGNHSAIIHYSPLNSKENKRELTSDTVLLMDSGAHYRDGTTDVTSTLWYGDNAPADFIKEFTLVLKGHIKVATTVFPKGMRGERIDSLARISLWKEGLNYAHGTGHGVGHYLNVHEGPAGIGSREDSGIEAGMVLTIEPGYYEIGKWGMRIENCYEVIPSKVASGADNFLTFDTLTLVPIQTKIIDKTLLTQGEISWLNDYHDRVLTTVGPYLRDAGKTVAHEWLKNNCRHI